MVDQTAVRDKITSVLTRDDLKKSIELVHYTTSINDYGELDETFSSQEVVYGIVKDYVEYAHKVDKAGLYKDSSYVVLLPITVTVSDTDEMNLFSQEFQIVKISKWILGETLLGHKIIIKEK